MKLNKLSTLLASALMMVAAVGCSDDNDPRPLDQTTASVENATFNTLTFEWDRVKDARQYSYQFANAATGDIIETAVTQSTTATFTDLEPSTEYTLTVRAYAAIGSGSTTSEPIVLTARTADIQPIASPVPTMTREVNTVIFQWEHVASAQAYSWSLTDADGNVIDSADETYTRNCSIANMQNGSYTFSVVALIDEPGLKDSEPGTIAFDFVREREEIWRTEGTYISALTGGNWTSILVAYDDNSYTIESWYGVDGYDFTFTIDETDASNMFKVSDKDYTYNSANGSYSVATGLTSPASVSVFPANNQCALEGTPGKGSVTLRVSDGATTGDDRISWGASIDDICGTWISHTSCTNVYDEETEETRTITITKIDDNTVSIPMVYFDNNNLFQFNATAVVDVNTMTFSISPISEIGGYTFASAAGENIAVTGTINPVKFSITGWDMYYGGWNYVNPGAIIEFTRP